MGDVLDVLDFVKTKIQQDKLSEVIETLDVANDVVIEVDIFQCGRKIAW